MKLQPGDHVAQKDLTDEQYHAIAKKFMEAGAIRGEYIEAKRGWQVQSYFGWVVQDGRLFHCGLSSHYGGRLLTPSQILEDDVWRGEGIPKIGTIVEFCGQGGEIENECYDNWINGDHLEVIAIRNVCGEPCAIVWNIRDETASGMDEKYFRPIKSDRDKAIAFAAEIMGLALTEHTQNQLNKLYHSGALKLPEGENEKL